jgi:hypothetical protein
MKIKHILTATLLAFTFSSHASLITIAKDDANNYGDQWSGNGGSGFDEWHFITDNAGGNAGRFLANKSTHNDLNHIASNPSDKGWGSYANGNGFNQFEAYRGFTGNSLTQTGDVFNLSFEHGGIIQGGAVGFVLRNKNIHNNIGDYNQQSRFEFGFIGGGQHYSIFDGQGTIDTGIGYTDAGLNLTFTLLSVDLYQLDIFSAVDNSLIQSRNGSLMGTGSIDSVSLYNRDAETSNAYFNGMYIQTNQSVSVTEPSSYLLIILALSLMLLAKRSKFS